MPAWLISALIKPILDWLLSKLKGLISSAQDVSETHQADSVVSQQDTQALEKITPTSSGDEISKAADDALKHL